MKLPPNTEFNEQVRLLIWRPRGVMNERAVNQIIEFIGSEEALNKPFDRFTDTLEANAIDLNFRWNVSGSGQRRAKFNAADTDKWGPVKKAWPWTKTAHVRQGFRETEGNHEGFVTREETEAYYAKDGSPP